MAEPTTGTAATGTATTGEAAPAFDPSQFVKAEDFARFEGKVTAMLDNFASVGKQPAQPQPTGPTISEKMAEYNAELERLDTELDAAVHEGKGASAIQRKREAIIQAQSDLKYGTKIAELESFGVNAIDQLSGEIVKGSMPHLTIAEVKGAYDQAINSMEPNQRMNPEARRLAYKFAIGENMERILELEKEKILRDVEETAKTTVPGAAGKALPGINIETGLPEGVPKPEEHFTQDNLDALDAKGQSVDDFCKSMGYEGWPDYWEKTIKEEEGE